MIPASPDFSPLSVPQPRAELLIGCGSRREKLLYQGSRQEWIGLVTLDSEPDHNPDHVWDLNVRPLPFATGSFDEIHAYEVLEHIGTLGDWRGLLQEFEEYWRILKPGGHLFATVPSWKSMGAFGDPGHTRVISAMTIAFLSQAEYEKQVGVTPMADYRSGYRGDFDAMLIDDDGESFRFILRAAKPSRWKPRGGGRA